MACRPITAQRTPQACACLLEYLKAAGCDIVVVTDHAADVVEKAHLTNLSVYIAPHALVEAIRNASGLRSRPLSHSAALLARWPLHPALAVHLRQSFPPRPKLNQLPLF